MKIYPRIDVAIRGMGQSLLDLGQVVQHKSWQSTTPPAPMFEALFRNFECPMPFIHEVDSLVKPNQPWAYEHFKERVSGIPWNPPPSHEIWPFANKSNAKFLESEKFSHTYPERFWPKEAGLWETRKHHGIRFGYGDLDDVINLLCKDTTTRQAYLPIWYPEDTGAVHGKRVPCTLGYHFTVRSPYLHITYYIRSCDYLRHFRDDVYFTIMLADYVGNRILKATNIELQLGLMRMDIINLHIFDGEQDRVKKLIRQ